MGSSLPDFLSFNNKSDDITFNWPNLSKDELLDIARDLHSENKFYKNLIYCGGSESDSVDGVVVVYFDNETSKKCKPKIDKLFDKIFSQDYEDSHTKSANSHNKSKKRKYSKPYSVHYNKTFTVAKNTQKDPLLPPNYFLSKSSSPQKKSENQSDRRVFNRKRFLCESQAGNVDLFSDHKPGIISDELRQALGLNKNELPVHIYKMRIFGYPPGWERTLLDSRKILMENVINYRGFNTPPSSKDIDKSYIYNCPSFSSSWSRQNYVYYLEDYVKKNPSPVVEERKHEVPLKRLPECSTNVSSSANVGNSIPKMPSDLGNPITTERTLIGLESTLLIRGERTLPPIENFSNGLMPLVLQDEKHGKGGGGYARCMKVLGKNVNRPNC